MSSEHDIEQLFEAYAKSRGCLCLKLEINGRRGFPDRTVFCPAGEVLFVEFKAPGGTGRASEQQKRWIDRLKKLGFQVLLTHSFSDAKQALDQTLEKGKGRCLSWLGELVKEDYVSDDSIEDVLDWLATLAPESEWRLDVANDGSAVLTHNGEECPPELLSGFHSETTHAGPGLPFEVDLSDLLG